MKKQIIILFLINTLFFAGIILYLNVWQQKMIKNFFNTQEIGNQEEKAKDQATYEKSKTVDENLIIGTLHFFSGVVKKIDLNLSKISLQKIDASPSGPLHDNKKIADSENEVMVLNLCKGISAQRAVNKKPEQYTKEMNEYNDSIQQNMNKNLTNQEGSKIENAPLPFVLEKINLDDISVGDKVEVTMEIDRELQENCITKLTKF